MQRTYDLNKEQVEFNINICYLDNEQKQIIKNNPHCGEFFCKLSNINDCYKCKNFLIKNKNMKMYYKKFDNRNMNQENFTFCNEQCNHGYIYDYLNRNDEKLSGNCDIDKYKNYKKFYRKKFIYKLNQIKYRINYENTFPKPKTVVHWGQLKMLLITIIFFINKIKQDDEKIHIIYPGSARGDDILILCNMFPNTIWHLIDPREHHPKLYNHPQIAEIITDFFTDEIAKYFYEKFKDRKYKLFLISDIRKAIDDESVLDDQESNIKWHKIISPDYSYFKFRCGYDTEEIYKYYKGKIFLQPFAPLSSTETRILLKNKLKEHDYNIKKYQGKMFYFNRIIRPSYHLKSIINENNYFDHCYDCTYFSYLIRNYLNKFPKFNPFETTDIFTIMMKITNLISKYTSNKILICNSYIRNNLI